MVIPCACGLTYRISSHCSSVVRTGFVDCRGFTQSLQVCASSMEEVQEAGLQDTLELAGAGLSQLHAEEAVKNATT